MKILVVLVFLFPIAMLAQKSPCACEPRGFLSTGITAGASATKPLLQTGIGMTWASKYFGGIGGGIDLYRFKSIPVFADLRRDFGKKKSLFGYAQGGYSIPFDNKSIEHGVNSFKTTDQFRGGLYFDAGFGYRARLFRSNALLMSAGYSQKNIRNKVGYTYPCLVPPCPEEIYENRYRLGRVVAKLSWEFNW